VAIGIGGRGYLQILAEKIGFGEGRRIQGFYKGGLPDLKNIQ